MDEGALKKIHQNPKSLCSMKLPYTQIGSFN